MLKPCKDFFFLNKAVGNNHGESKYCVHKWEPQDKLQTKEIVLLGENYSKMLINFHEGFFKNQFTNLLER